MEDEKDGRGIELDRVGITGLRHQVTIRDRAGRDRTAPAAVTMSVRLPADARAVHMSRFVSVLERHAAPLGVPRLRELLEDLRRELASPSASVEFAFAFFVEKRAPRTGSRGFLACDVRLAASLSGSFESEVGVRVPVLTVCPCSVGNAGAAGLGQRGYVSVAVRPGDALAIEDLVELVEGAAGSPVYPLLRGPDEQAVIEAALSRPLFVEDLVRGVTERLNANERTAWYSVTAENLESVHDHSVFASIEHRR